MTQPPLDKTCYASYHKREPSAGQRKMHDMTKGYFTDAAARQMTGLLSGHCGD